MDELLIAFLIIVGGLLTIIGLLILFYAFSRKKYGVEISGKVADIRIISRKEHGRECYYENPIVEYELAGKLYKKEVPLMKETDSYFVGQELKLRVSEKKPSGAVYIIGENKLFIRAYAVIFVGLLFVVIALVNYFK